MIRVSLITFYFVMLCQLTAGAEAAKDTADKDNYLKPEIVIALIIPLVTALGWLARDYMNKHQVLNKEQLKAEMTNSFAITLEEVRNEYEEITNLRIQPLQHLIERLAEEVSRQKAIDKRVEDNLRHLQEHTVDVRVRLKVVEHRLDNILDTINAELSAILTAYLEEPVKVKLFFPHKGDSKTTIPGDDHV